MKRIEIITLILLTLFCVTGKAEEVETKNPMVLYPELYINITDWSFYAAARVAIIHHVTIENTSDIAYKNIKVKVYYYSRSYSNYGQLISNTTGVLPITLPPHSNKTYLEGGTTLGAGSMNFEAANIQVLGATPLVVGGMPIKEFSVLRLN